jgi:hypothetical protein
MSYFTHFGLDRAPFSKEIADADLWLPPSKTALVNELIEALAQRASVLLVGEPGVGKTCVLRALRSHLPAADYRLTYCHNATLGRRDFYRQLCLALGLRPSATAAAIFCFSSTECGSRERDLGAAEKDHGNQRDDAVKAIRAVFENRDFVIQSLHATIRQSERDGGEDPIAVLAQSARQPHERAELGSTCPREPRIEMATRRPRAAPEERAQLLFQVLLNSEWVMREWMTVGERG